MNIVSRHPSIRTKRINDSNPTPQLTRILDASDTLPTVHNDTLESWERVY